MQANESCRFAKIAIERAIEINDNVALVSDGFFPMGDTVEYAAEHGIKAIIQPGGSIKDQDSIDMANKYGITMVMTVCVILNINFEKKG